MKRLQKLGCWLVFGGAFAASSVARAQNPPTGVVYGCYSRSASGPSFVLIDGSTYNSRQGAAGKYKFDAGTGMLTMLTGPYQGIHYTKEDASFTFRVLRDDMSQTATTCPINKGKDPNKRPW